MQIQSLSLRSRRRQLQSRRRGQAMFLFAIGIIALCGCCALAVDYSVLLSDRNRLQRACDAAALAGAAELKKTNDSDDTTKAKQIAVDVAKENNVTVNSADITFLSSYSQIRVPATLVRQTFFARVLSIQSKTVATYAIASVANGTTITTEKGDSRVVPVGITWETYNSYKNDGGLLHNIAFTRENKDVFDINQFILFDLRETNAKSPNYMERQLIGQDNETVTIGDKETTLNASATSQQNKLESALTTIFTNAADKPWYDGSAFTMLSAIGVHYNQVLAGTEPANNPRVMYLIVSQKTTDPITGTYDAPVEGFAPVYVESYSVLNGVPNLQVRFLPPTYSSDSSGSGSTTTQISGLRVVSLIS